MLSLYHVLAGWQRVSIFIHSFTQYLLSAYALPGTDLGMMGVPGHRTTILTTMELAQWWGESALS